MINSDTKGFAISNPYKAAEHQGAPWLLVISVRRGVKTRQVAILGTSDVVPYVQDSTRRGEASRGRQKFHLQIKLLLVNIRFFCVAGGPGPALVRGAWSAFPFHTPFRYGLTHGNGANASNSGSKIEITFRWIGVFCSCFLFEPQDQGEKIHPI